MVRRAIMLFVGALALYCGTLAASLNWGDGGRIQLDIVLGGSNYWFLPELSHAPLDPGPFARLGVTPWDHPLYILLGRAALSLPLGSIPVRLSFLSALAAAAVVALAYRVALEMGANCTGAALGALALGVSHTFWLHAVTTEVLALHCLFMITLLWLTLRWSDSRRMRELRWFALVAGLGLANHVMLLLTLVPSVVYMALVGAGNRSGERPGWRTVRSAGGLIALFLVGFAPWWIQFVRVVRVTGLGLALEATTWLPAGSDTTVTQALADVATNLVGYAGYLLFQFTPLGVALGIAGFAILLKTRPALAKYLAALFVIHVAFSANFPFEDRYTFHLPSYLIFALCIGVGATAVLQAVRPTASPRVPIPRLAGLVLGVVVAPVVLYGATPAMLRAADIDDADLGIPNIGHEARDGLAYFLNPNKRGDDSAQRFGRSTLALLAPDAVVVTPRPDLEVSVVLRYLQHVEGLRPDVYIDPFAFVPLDKVPRALAVKARAVSACRPFYVASMMSRSYARQLRREFRVTSEANLYRVAPRRPTGTGAPCPPPFERETVSQIILKVLR